MSEPLPVPADADAARVTRRKRRSGWRAACSRRYWAERRFRAYGMTRRAARHRASCVFLFATIIGKGASVFRQAYVQLDVFYDPAIIDPAGTRKPDDLAQRGLPGARPRRAQGALPAASKGAAKRASWRAS